MMAGLVNQALGFFEMLLKLCLHLLFCQAQDLAIFNNLIIFQGKPCFYIPARLYRANAGLRLKDYAIYSLNRNFE